MISSIFYQGVKPYFIIKHQKIQLLLPILCDYMDSISGMATDKRCIVFTIKHVWFYYVFYDDKLFRVDSVFFNQVGNKHLLAS